MRVDLHVHTYRSPDSLSRPKEVLEWMDRNGVDVVAITDHDAIDGAREVAALAPERIIVGEEIRTSAGEIIGLFLTAFIAPGLPPLETVAAIHAQGGLVYVPHPCDRTRGSTLTREALLSIIQWIDVLETYNARVIWRATNRQARELAEAHALAMGAGSDAHRARDIGLATVTMPAFVDATGFKRAIGEGTIRGRLTGVCGRLSGIQARFAGRRAGAISETGATREG